jgi:hypothetical protein
MTPDPRIDERPDDEAGIHYVEREAGKELELMERESERVERDIAEARSDWERKLSDPGVPGAERPWPEAAEDEEEPLEEVAGDWSGEAEGAERAGQ